MARKLSRDIWGKDNREMTPEVSKTKREVGRRDENGLGEPTGGWGSNPDRLAPCPLRPREVLQLPTSGQYLQSP